METDGEADRQRGRLADRYTERERGKKEVRERRSERIDRTETQSERKREEK